jgi:hypothetical protein
MADDSCQVLHVIALEEHVWTPELRVVLLKFGGDDKLANKVALELTRQPV